ncbi:CCA tRNA nucleotidyltransferase [Angustibacter luteus]|uniref:CCA tRNA nucleotidyltransferase n=1 Tax=Angustibacter luteus TaxID=658456 RepID=A0ABW1JDL6_9ACTN
MTGFESRVPFPGTFRLSEAASTLLDALAAVGGRPFVVGGSVRDALLEPELTFKDVDVEVFHLDVDAVAAALRTVGLVDEVGRAFSVLKVRVDGQDFDVSLPRREVKSGDGHRGFDVVADPRTSLVKASARRDFTLNALLFDPATGELVDCWGGLDDLRAGVLRHTTPAFAEDPLRVLRAVQFAARFGLRLAPETAELCRELVGEFEHLSTERVWTEWYKIATRGKHMARALTVLVETGWDVHFPELSALRGLKQDLRWHPEGDVFTHTGLAGDQAARLADEAGLVGDDRAVIVLGTLLHDVGKVDHTQFSRRKDGTLKVSSHGHAEAGVAPARTFLRAIGAPHHLTRRVLPLVAEHMVTASTNKPTAAAVRRLARRLAPATMTEWALVVEADKGGRGRGSRPGGTGPWLALAEEVGAEQTPVTGLLRGEHLIEVGMMPGPAFGPLLRAALAAQDDGEFEDEAGAKTWLAARLHTSS